MTSAHQTNVDAGSSPHDTPYLIFLERVQALYRPRIESVASGLVVGAVLAVALSRYYSWLLIFVWYLGICLVQFGRGALLKLSRFKTVQIKDPKRWGRRYMLDVAAAGLYWSVSLAVLVKPEDLLMQSFMAWTIGGLAVGSITVHAYHPPVMYTFLACLLLPFSARLAWVGDFPQVYLGLGLLLLGAYLALYGRLHTSTLVRSIALRHENRLMLAQLEGERAAAVILQSKAEVASQSKSRFFAGASHDLRQPLQALSLYASVLSDSKLPADLHRVSLRMGASVQLLEELFEGVLDIAHIEAGGMTIKREPVCVQELMDRALLLFGGEALDKGLSLKCVPSSAWVMGDRMALQRIVSNLVANAVRHTHAGRVVIGVRRRGGLLRLMVLDTGPGIEAALHERIFEEFYRLPTAQGRGFGLGLASVKRLCDAAAYRLGFNSIPGRGSAFWVELPEAKAPVSEVGAATSEPMGHHPLGLTVLLVEDDPDVRVALETSLRSWGYHCLSAESFDAAMGILSNGSPHLDVVISDYNLAAQGNAQHFNGLELIAAARRATHSELPALLISGAMDSTLRSLAQSADCIALPKPVRSLQLRAVLDRIAAKL